MLTLHCKTVRMPRKDIDPKKRREYYDRYMEKNRDAFNKQVCLRRAMQNKTLPTLRSILKYNITDEELQKIGILCVCLKQTNI